ncbi:MAG: hypothetical protein A2284_01205 [Deltaproteobacteria bacterium RIFOXYA12_FULL_61_11]|nr:MAG: hypothetical protein A2284_01205 [Deltaproteobacteria bacterium RIFOXYA12_FULL_61_11]
MRPRSGFLLPTLLILTPALLFLMVNEKGLVKVFRLHHELDQIEHSVQALSKENKALSDEIDRLENDAGHLERLVRQEYGYVHKNDVVLTFK